ncbi:hypothetical protein ACNVED_14545 [Legionella sp. D16C41]|uniref:hypothetical protein n=1 Tax=Legionella sp. D16C41 TaxID=3402688 RepID=UPI003AF5A80A
MRWWWNNSEDSVNAQAITQSPGNNSWWNRIKGWGSDLWNSNTVAETATNVSSFTYNTILKSFELAPAAVKTVASVITHTQTRQIAYHIARIFAEDIAPLVAVNYAFDSLKKYSEDELIDKNAEWVSATTLLQTSLGLLQAALWVYNTRKKTQATVRMAVVAFEASKSLNTVNSDLPKQICIEKKCDLLRYVRGNFRDLTTFWATEAALSLIGYIPFGDKVVAVLSVYHRGRYALTMVLPDLCQRHQVEYLKENAELSLALGLYQLGATLLLSWGIESLTNIPSKYYQPFVAQAMLLTQISVAAHSRLPRPIDQSQRKVFDPVGAYQSLISLIFDIVASGLKKQIPKLLKGPPADIPWQKIYNAAIELQQYSYIQKIETIALPRMLHSPEAFISDPVIQPYWKYLRERSILALTALEDLNAPFLKISEVATYDPKKAAQLFLIKVATYDPKKAAKLLWLIFGMPKSVSREVLKQLGNQKFMLDIGSWRRKLETLEVRDSLKEFDSSPLTLQLRQPEPKQEITLPPKEENSKEEEGNNTKIDAKEIINPNKNSGSTRAKDIIITSTKRSTPKKPPVNLIQTKFNSPSKVSAHNLGLFDSAKKEKQDQQKRVDPIDSVSFS